MALLYHVSLPEKKIIQMFFDTLMPKLYVKADHSVVISSVSPLVQRQILTYLYLPSDIYVENLTVPKSKKGTFAWHHTP